MLANFMKYLLPVLMVQRNTFNDAKASFFRFSRFAGVIEFVGIAALCVLMYAVLWYQSSRGLGNRIIKAKRMLSMMSMELVINNEALKERVLSKEFNRVLA